VSVMVRSTVLSLALSVISIICVGDRNKKMKAMVRYQKLQIHMMLSQTILITIHANEVQNNIYKTEK